MRACSLNLTERKLKVKLIIIRLPINGLKKVKLIIIIQIIYLINLNRLKKIMNSINLDIVIKKKVKIEIKK